MLGWGEVVEGMIGCSSSNSGDLVQSPAALPSIGLGGGSCPVGLPLCSILSDLKYSKQIDITILLGGVCCLNLSESNGQSNQNGHFRMVNFTVTYKIISNAMITNSAIFQFSLLADILQMLLSSNINLHHSFHLSS